MTAMHSFAETGRPEIPAAESFAIREPLAARKMLGLADLPTVVALGPFDDLTQSENLAAAFTAVRRFCMAQLVLLGAHDRRTEAIRGGIGLGAEKRVHVVDATRGSRWSDLIVAADLVVVGPTSGETCSAGCAGGRPRRCCARGPGNRAPCRAIERRAGLPTWRFGGHDGGDVTDPDQRKPALRNGNSRCGSREAPSAAADDRQRP